MAYMPAGEEDDFDSDDGFIDNETSYQNKTPYLNYDPAVSTGGGHMVTNGSNDKSVSWTQSNSNFGEQRERGIFPKYQSANALSMEDFKRAAARGNSELVERCLSQGLGIDEPLRCGWTVLMYAGNYGQSDMVKLLLSKGADPNGHCDMFTVLMSICSACTQDEEQIRASVQILAEAGVDIDAKDRFHTTALMLASKEGHVLAVKELIKHGADVNRQDSRGWTALTWATQRSAKSVVYELLNSGADPNIQHMDKLTVKDLAAHMPNDEMLALLEYRPASLDKGAGDTTMCTNKDLMTGNYLTGTSSRSTDLRYGELEVFLLGLDLSHLINLFQQQLIDFNLLMTLTEQDLINAGIDQIGARKKLLDAVQALHKTNWQPSSLVSIHFNKQIRCADAVAILANTSKHLGYIGSTIIYVKEQLRRHPEQVTQPTDEVNIRQLVRHTEDATKNVIALTAELERLQSDILKGMKKRTVDSPDFVNPTDRKTTRRFCQIGCCIVVGLCLSALVCYRRDSLHKFLPDKVLDLFYGDKFWLWKFYSNSL